MQLSSVHANITNKTIVLRFDDAPDDQYDNAIPTMSTYGFKGSLGAVSDLVGTTSGTTTFMTWAELQTLSADGNEISSHSKTHPASMNALSQTDLDAETDGSADAFVANDLPRPTSFTYPNSLGYNNLTVKYSLLNAGYALASTGGNTYWNSVTGNRFAINTYSIDGIDGDTTLAYFQSKAELATGDVLVVFLFHHVGDNIRTGGYASGYYVNQTDFDADMGYLHDNGYVVKTFRELGLPASENEAGRSTDGFIYATSTTYATAQGAATGTLSATATNSWCGQVKSGSNYIIYRTFLYFDCSTIPDDATIDSAYLQLTSYSDSSTTDFLATIINGQPTYPSEPLTATDYAISQYSTSPNGGTYNTTNGWTANTAYNFTLSATGLGWIQKNNTITKFGLVSSLDIAATAPTGEERIRIWLTESTTAAYRPVLYIFWTPSSTTTTQSTTIFTTIKATGKLTTSKTTLSVTTTQTDYETSEIASTTTTTTTADVDNKETASTTVTNLNPESTTSTTTIYTTSNTTVTNLSTTTTASSTTSTTTTTTTSTSVLSTDTESTTTTITDDQTTETSTDTALATTTTSTSIVSESVTTTIATLSSTTTLPYYTRNTVSVQIKYTESVDEYATTQYGVIIEETETTYYGILRTITEGLKFVETVARDLYSNIIHQIDKFFDTFVTEEIQEWEYYVTTITTTHHILVSETAYTDNLATMTTTATASTVTSVTESSTTQLETTTSTTTLTTTTTTSKSTNYETASITTSTTETLTTTETEDEVTTASATTTITSETNSESTITSLATTTTATSTAEYGVVTTTGTATETATTTTNTVDTTTTTTTTADEVDPIETATTSSTTTVYSTTITHTNTTILSTTTKTAMETVLSTTTIGTTTSTTFGGTTFTDIVRYTESVHRNVTITHDIEEQNIINEYGKITETVEKYYDELTTSLKTSTETIIKILMNIYDEFVEWLQTFQCSTTAYTHITQYIIVNKNVIIIKIPTVHSITFAVDGVGEDFAGDVITINGETKTLAEMPFTDAYYDGQLVMYSYESALSVNATHQYGWVSTNGLGQSQQSNLFIVSNAGTVTGTYDMFYLLTINTSGIVNDTAPKQVVVLNNHILMQSELPYSAWVRDNATITYYFSSPVRTAPTIGYQWDSTDGLGQTERYNTFQLTDTGTITGTYIEVSDLVAISGNEINSYTIFLLVLVGVIGAMITFLMIKRRE